MAGMNHRTCCCGGNPCYLCAGATPYRLLLTLSDFVIPSACVLCSDYAGRYFKAVGTLPSSIELVQTSNECEWEATLTSPGLTVQMHGDSSCSSLIYETNVLRFVASRVLGIGYWTVYIQAESTPYPSDYSAQLFWGRVSDSNCHIERTIANMMSDFGKCYSGSSLLSLVNCGSSAAVTLEPV
jgi:hypothetical protein